MSHEREVSVGDRLARIDGRLHDLEDHAHQVLRHLTSLAGQWRKLMAQNAELKAFLDSLNVYTNEIATDIDTLLAAVAAGQPLSDEDRAALAAHSETLRAIAAKAGDPLPPPVEPPA